MLYLLRDLAFQIKRHSLAGALGVFSNRGNYLKKFRERRKAKNSKETFEISKDIERIGIIRYLWLDDDKTVEALGKKYRNTKQGIDLLMKLLEDRYHGRYP